MIKIFTINNLNLNLNGFSLKNISLKSDAKNIVILGQSGGGKTVFLETIAGKYHQTDRKSVV